MCSLKPIDRHIPHSIVNRNLPELFGRYVKINGISWMFCFFTAEQICQKTDVDMNIGVSGMSAFCNGECAAFNFIVNWRLSIHTGDFPCNGAMLIFGWKNLQVKVCERNVHRVQSPQVCPGLSAHSGRNVTACTPFQSVEICMCHIRTAVIQIAGKDQNRSGNTADNTGF